MTMNMYSYIKHIYCIY